MKRNNIIIFPKIFEDLFIYFDFDFFFVGSTDEINFSQSSENGNKLLLSN